MILFAAVIIVLSFAIIMAWSFAEGTRWERAFRLCGFAVGALLCALPVIAVALYAMWQYPLLAVIGIMALLCIIAEVISPGTT